MDKNMARVATILIIATLTAFVVWYTANAWGLLGLFGLVALNFFESAITAVCPNCNHEFVAMRKEYDEDEEDD